MAKEAEKAQQTPKAQKAQKLTSARVRHLRALGHHLKPVVFVGKNGIDDNLVKSVNENLAAHELIKVKIGENAPEGRKETAAALAQAAGCVLAQVIGRVCLLYRANPDLPPEKRIVFPR